MLTVVQKTKYLQIAEKHNLNITEADIMYLQGFISGMIKSELNTLQSCKKKMKTE